ncbi:MAG: FAD-dependent oxidoreductase [Coriobacteriales bacterium]
MRNVVVIGAGASGLAAAIAAARAGAHVTVLEGDVKPGRKLLRTGNGRCNLTNARIDVAAGDDEGHRHRHGGNDDERYRHFEDAAPLSMYNDPSFVRPTLERLGCREIVDFFSSIGLLCYEDQEGRMYPVTNRARSVLDVLVGECARLGASIECGKHVREIREGDAGFGALLDDGSVVHADAIVLATGAEAAPVASLSLPLVPQAPVLGALRTAPDIVRRMEGVRMRCGVRVEGRDLAAEGEVLFRPFGVSGIVVFDLSRFIGEGDVLSLDLLPFMERDALMEELERRKLRDYAPLASGASLDSKRSAKRAKKRASELDGMVLRLFDGLVVREVADAVLAYCGLDTGIRPADLPVDRVADALKDLRLTVTGGPEAAEAQAMRGGIATDAVDAESLAIDGHPGLYACGETLDVDAACGGFNLHWAWASGLTAGASAANR